MMEAVLGLAVCAVAGGVLALARVVTGVARQRVLTLPERAIAAGALGAVVCFAALILGFTHAAGPLDVDRLVHGAVGAAAGDARAALMQALTVLGDWRVHFAVLLLFGVPKFSRTHGWTLFVYGGALVATGLTILAFKSGLGRARPDDAMMVLADRAFPSGHAAMGLAFWFAVGVFVGRLAPRARLAGVAIAVLVPAAIAYTRLFLKVHWITDILGGWLLALFWLALAVLVDRLSLELPELARMRARFER
jgi:membrane-associated phospholipid phosphatase